MLLVVAVWLRCNKRILYCIVLYCIKDTALWSSLAGCYWADSVSSGCYSVDLQVSARRARHGSSLPDRTVFAHRCVSKSPWYRLASVYKVAVLTFKVLHGSAPRYLGQLVPVADLPSRRTLRSGGTNRLMVLSVRRSTVGDRAFTVAGPRVWNWNTLPEEITTSQTLSSFRQQLKTWLFGKSYPDIIIWTSSLLYTLQLTLRCYLGNPWLIDWLIATTIDLDIPRCRLSTYGTRAFSVAGPVCWNAFYRIIYSHQTSHLIVSDTSWQHFCYSVDIEN